MSEYIYEHDDEIYYGVENDYGIVTYYPTHTHDHSDFIQSTNELLDEVEQITTQQSRTLTGDIVGGVVDTVYPGAGDIVGGVVDGLLDGSLSGSVSCSGTTTTANTNVQITENVAYSVDIYNGSSSTPSTSYQSVISNLFGDYEPKTTTTYYYFNDSLVTQGETAISGLAGLDYNWLASVYLFGLSLKYVYKFLSGAKG